MIGIFGFVKRFGGKPFGAVPAEMEPEGVVGGSVAADEVFIKVLDDICISGLGIGEDAQAQTPMLFEGFDRFARFDDFLCRIFPKLLAQVIGN